MVVLPSRGGSSERGGASTAPPVVRWRASFATFCSLLLLATAHSNDRDTSVATAVRRGLDVGGADDAAANAWRPRRSLTSQYTGPSDSRPIAHHGASGRRTIISQANHGALAVEFKTVLTFSLPLVRNGTGRRENE